jgi:hypothetical protein
LARLVQIAQRVDAPPLRIASCLRAMLLGDKSRRVEFKKMLSSTDPAYKKIFEDTLWVKKQSQ